MSGEMKYDAFISYRHLAFDKKVAVKLQKLLESYRPPASVVPKGAFRPFRVFRDETELSTSNSLSDAIREALRHTRFLVVVCSLGTAASKWCMEEITYFKELHGGSTQNIRVIVIDGDPAKVMPEELLFEEQTVAPNGGQTETRQTPVEPLALNITASSQRQSLKKLKTEYLRIIATLMDIDFASLYQRDQRRQMQRAAVMGSAAGLLLLSIAVFTSVMLVYANRQKDLAQAQTLLAEENLAKSNSLLMEGALDHAVQRSQDGARAQSAILLHYLYNELDPTWDNYDQLTAQFRNAALGALYYDPHSVYATLDVQESVLDIAFSPDRPYTLVTVSRVLYLMETASGQPLQTFSAPENDTFTSSVLLGETAIAGTQNGSLVIANLANGETSVLENACENPIEKLAYRPEKNLLAMIDCRLVSGQNTEEVLLTLLPLDADTLAPIPDSAQRFTAQTDIRGDIDIRYSFSENGRFLATKKNVDYERVGEELLFDIDAKDILVMDADAFDPDKTPEENQDAMTTQVDCRFWPQDIYVAARYHIANDGILLLDAQTILYHGSEELGYLVGHSTGDKEAQQRIAAYDVPGENLLFSEAVAGPDTDLFFSSFVPVAECGGFFPYFRYNSETKESRLEVYALEKETGPAYTTPLPENVYGSYQCVAIAASYETNPPSYVVTVTASSGASRSFHLKYSTATELDTGSGSCTVMTIDNPAGLYAAGYRSGQVYLSSIESSLEQVTQPQDDVVQVIDGEICSGTQGSGIFLQQPEDTRLTLLSYSDDRTKAFGLVSPLTYRDSEPDEDSLGHFIWSLETGEILLSLDSLETREYYETLRISGDFSYIVVNESSFFPRFSGKYVVYDTTSGRMLRQYETRTRYNYFGLGRSQDELWFISTDTGILETVNIQTGQTLQREYIQNRPLRDVSDRIFYNPDKDYVIINNDVYSFLSQSVVFSLDAIESVRSDTGMLYHSPSGRAISLSPKDLFRQLSQLDYIGNIRQEDLDAAGIANSLPGKTE